METGFASERPGWIGHYRILKELGSGGQGIVYLAHDERLDRDVAIKRLRGTYSKQHLERFRREARIASRLDHPGICAIYEIADEATNPYFVMRYVNGTTIAARIHALRMSATPSFSFVDEDDRGLDSPLAETAHAARSPDAPRTPDRDEPNGILRLIEQTASVHEA